MKPAYFIPFLMLACNASPQSIPSTPEPVTCEYLANIFMNIPKAEEKVSWHEQEVGADSGFILHRFNMRTNDMRILIVASPHLLSASSFNERFHVVQRDLCTMRDLVWSAVQLQAIVPIKSTGG